MTEYRIFVATTGENTDLRRVIDTVVKQLEQSLDSIRFRTVDWYRDIFTPMGQPAQATILQESPPVDWDIFLGVLWHRFGMPTGVTNPKTNKPFPSGTIQEFFGAYGQTSRGLPLLFYQRDEPVNPSKIDPAQLKEVQAFFADVKKGKYGGAAKTFETTSEFENHVRSDLGQCVRLLQKRI